MPKRWRLLTLGVCLLGIPVLASAAGCLPRPVPAATPSSRLAPEDFGCLFIQTEHHQQTWVVAGGHEPRLLTQGSIGYLSADGRFSALLRSFPVEVWLVAVDGSVETKVFTAQPLVYGLVWSPDSTMFVVTTGAHAKHMPSNDLWRVDVPSGTVRQLASANAGDPVFSPDGRWIALSVGHWSPVSEIAIMRSDGEDHRVLFEGLISQRLEWARDSSGFAVALKRVGAEDQRGTELWWVPVAGAPRQLGRLADAMYVSWQPGAERLMYKATGPEEQMPLRMANREGSRDRVVPGSDGMILQAGGGTPWSPDGHWFLTGRKERGAFSYYLVDANRLGRPRRLDMQTTHGWLDSAHFLTSSDGEAGVDLYRCVPLGRCEFLAHVSDRIAAWYYVPRCPV